MPFKPVSQLVLLRFGSSSRNGHLRVISAAELGFIVFALCISAASLVIFTYKHTRDRHELLVAKKVAKERQSEALRVMLTALQSSDDSFSGGGGGGRWGDAGFVSKLRDVDRVCFVVTDLEGSTEASNADARGYKHLQETHDRIMRELITLHHGREINTQGDSFEIVFREAHDALTFSLEIQRRMLEEPWPKNVLRLPHCEQVTGVDAKNREGGDEGRTIIFSGARVRMAVHVARRGEFSCRLHDMSKHLVFEGEGFKTARVLSDAAHGGQVLMTRATLDALLSTPGGLTAAGNPVVERVGFFDLSAVLGAAAAESSLAGPGSVHHDDNNAAKAKAKALYNKDAADGVAPNTNPNVWELYHALPRWGSRTPWRSFGGELCLDDAKPAIPPVDHSSSRRLRTMNIVPVETLLDAATEVDGHLQEHEPPTGGSRLSVVIMHAVEPVPRQCVAFSNNLVMAITQQFGGVVMPLLNSSPPPPPPPPPPPTSSFLASSQRMPSFSFSSAGVRKSASCSHVGITVNPLHLFAEPVALVFTSASDACSCASTIQLACGYAFGSDASASASASASAAAEDDDDDDDTEAPPGVRKPRSSSGRSGGRGSNNISSSSRRKSRDSRREVPRFAWLMHASGAMRVERVKSFPKTWMETPPVGLRKLN